MGNFEILSWDSDFFKFKVAKITSKNFSDENIRLIFSDLKQNNVRLVYWQSEKKWEDLISIDINEISGILVDIKTTYMLDIEKIAKKEIVMSECVKSYDSDEVTPIIRNIAIQSGEYSRFAIDPSISSEKFESLYTIWIERSVRRELADDVLIIYENDKIAGLVTLKKAGKRGSIGLIAVDSHYRGKRYGEKLLKSAIIWFQEHECRFVTVVTQGTNAQANNLYKKNGFCLETIQYYYHFWL